MSAETIKPRICKNCRCWERIGNTILGQPANGECRRFPPQVVAMPTPQGYAIGTQPPICIETFVCEEFTRRTAADELR